MNILILSWRDPENPLWGGAEISTLEHAKEWVKRGHSVTWYSSSFKNSQRKGILDGVKIIRMGHYVFGVQFMAFLWFKFAKRAKFDLVVDQFHGIPFFTPLYVKEKKLGFIHEVTKDVWKYNPWPKPFNLIPSIIGEYFEPYIFKIIYRKIPFMTVSESTKKDLIGWGVEKDNITVIKNGVSVIRVDTKKGRIKTALFLGQIAKDKGVFDAIEIFKIINASDYDWQFWIVGKGQPEVIKELKKTVKRYNLENHVRFFGFVSDKKKYELIGKSHVLINTSIHEGWGLVNIEANSCGVPVLGYKVSGMVDSVINGKTGILVERGDVHLLSREAIRLVNDEKRYKTFSENCVKWAKKHTWEKATKESLELIESL